jgi:hypothetical protein
MDDEKEPVNEPAHAAPNTSENIEVPKEKGSGGWQMPDPVFRQTSGYLPQGFEKRFPMDPQADISTDEPVADIPAAAPEHGQFSGAAPAAAPAPPIEISESPDVRPQPELTEEFSLADEQVAPAVAVKKRSPAVSIALTLLGILAMIAFAIGFLVTIWYLFFYHPNDPQILN